MWLRGGGTLDQILVFVISQSHAVPETISKGSEKCPARFIMCIWRFRFASDAASSKRRMHSASSELSPSSDGTNWGCQLGQFSSFLSNNDQCLGFQWWGSGDGSLITKLFVFVTAARRKSIVKSTKLCSGGLEGKRDAMLGTRKGLCRCPRGCTVRQGTMKKEAIF